MKAFREDLTTSDYEAVYRIRRPDGEVRWIHDRGLPVFGSDGEILHFAGVARDVTSEHFASAGIAPLIQSSTDAILVLNLEDGRIVGCNPAAERIYGYESREAEQLTIKELIPHRLAEESESILEELRSGRAISGLETSRRRKDGSEVRLKLSAWTTMVGGKPAVISLAHPLDDPPRAT